MHPNKLFIAAAKIAYSSAASAPAPAAAAVSAAIIAANCINYWAIALYDLGEQSQIEIENKIV